MLGLRQLFLNGAMRIFHVQTLRILIFPVFQQTGEKDFRDNALKESTGKTTKDEDVSKSRNGDTICSWENRVERDISSHSSLDGIQRGLTLCDQGQPAKSSTQGQSAGYECVTELRVTKHESVEEQSGVNDPLGQNAEGTLSPSNLIAFREDTGSKDDSDCQVCASSPTAINQALSLPSLPASQYGNNPKSDLISSTAAMFTSTLVSVLAPHWSGRLRRHKRGFSDVGADFAQNMNLSATSPNEQRQLFPLHQTQAQDVPVNDFSNGLRGSAGTSRRSVEWQNESGSHFSESKNQFMKNSSLRVNRHVVGQTTELGNPVQVSVDSSEVPRSTGSLQLSDYRRMAQSVDQGESFSSLRSRPTTSTLLLSTRRLNSRKPIPESFQMNKQLSASISSLNLPSKSILRFSQPQPNLVSPTDQAKKTLGTKTVLASPDQLSGTHDPTPVSPKCGEMDSSRKHPYLITGDFDVISRTPPATNDTTRERPFSNYATRVNQSETLRSVQHHGAVERSLTDNKNLQDSIRKIPERSAWVSPKENAHSRFVYPQTSSNLNSDSILKRRISRTSTTSTNLDPSTSVQSNRINDTINSNKTCTINSATSPRTIQSITTSPSISLSPAPLTQVDQNNIQNSSSSDKPSLSPMSSIRMRTFTESLSFSPRKDSPVEGTSPSHLWSNYLNSMAQSKESNKSPLDQSSPLTPSEFKPRRVCIPSIYKYLRETSPNKNTQASPALSSPSPQTSSFKQTSEEDKISRNSRFTFDLSPVISHDPLMKPDSSSCSAPQSLQPETSRRPVSDLSKSPYSTLISTRAAVKSLSSPPVTHQHTRSFSYGGSPVDAKSAKMEKRSYTSVLRERLSQRKSRLGEPVASTDIQVPANLCQDGISKSSTDIKFPDCQSNTLIPDTTHPKKNASVIKNIPHVGVNGIFLSQGGKSNTYTTDRLNSKVPSLPRDASPVSETVQNGGGAEILQASGTCQTSEGPTSKKILFSLRNKKDNVLSSSSSADKEGLAVKKGELAGLKPTKKVDQVLNRLRLTLGGKFLEESDTTSRRKTKKEEASNDKACESITKEKESDDLPGKRQTKPKELLDSKASERTMKLDQVDDPTIRTQTKPETVSDITSPERSRKLAQMGDLTVRTQTNPEKVLDSKAPEGTMKLDQKDDPTVRRKTDKETLLDMTCETKRKVEQRLSPNHILRSPNSPNTPITMTMDSCTPPCPTLGLRHDKQDNLTSMDKHSRLMEESRNQFLDRNLSLNWTKPDINNCYATLPPGKRSRLGPSPTLSPFECFSEDEQNDNVFFTNVQTKRNHTSLGELENVPPSDNNSVKARRQNSTGVVLPSASADLKYGLQRGRSVSVSSVVSGRPSGPGRISTGSRQSSISDLSSLDAVVTKSRHSSINSSVGSPEKDGTVSSGLLSYKGTAGWLPSEGRLRSPDNLEAISFTWDMEADPTPPPSPVQTRRVSQSLSPSSARTSPDSLSPRGFLPSRNYKTGMLSVNEESGSETTTDDEYYLNSDDDEQKETEL